MRTSVRFRTLVAVAAATALFVAPATVWAFDKFVDVPDSNVFHDDITWLADAGVTLGCNPPDNDEFCPDDSVTREQMAAFMRRLAENQVVDAASALTADSADSATTAASAATASDADTLDGVDSTEFVKATGEAVLRGAGWYSETTDDLRDSTGIVTGVSKTGTGVYLVELSENIGVAFINVTSVNITGRQCNWAINGSLELPNFEVYCRNLTNNGALADASFTFTIHDNPLSPESTSDWIDPNAGLTG